MKEMATRRSIRKYKSDEVPREDVRTVLQAGTLAPSAKNRQPWKYHVYTSDRKDRVLDVMEAGLIRERDKEALLPESRSGLPDAFYTLKVMRQAPVLIVIENTNGTSPFVEINTDDRITELCDTLSIGASVQNILLKATELGYGTLWIANTCYAYPEVADFVGVAGQLVGAISLGVPDEAPDPRPRKALADVIVFKEQEEK